MALDLEYLEEAVVEAAAAAEWYAARSATAAAGFEAELAEAESAIQTLPNAWPPYDYGTRRYLLRRYPFGVVYRIELKTHPHRRRCAWSSPTWVLARSRVSLANQPPPPSRP